MRVDWAHLGSSHLVRWCHLKGWLADGCWLEHQYVVFPCSLSFLTGWRLVSLSVPKYQVEAILPLVTLPQKSYSIIFPVGTDLPRFRRRDHRRRNVSITLYEEVTQSALWPQSFTFLLLAKHSFTLPNAPSLTHYDNS